MKLAREWGGKCQLWTWQKPRTWHLDSPYFPVTIQSWIPSILGTILENLLEWFFYIFIFSGNTSKWPGGNFLNQRIVLAAKTILSMYYDGKKFSLLLMQGSMRILMLSKNKTNLKLLFLTCEKDYLHDIIYSIKEIHDWWFPNKQEGINLSSVL